MSNIIKDLLTEYGLGIDNEIVYNSLVSFLAVIVMLGIILMISKLVSPSASRTRAVLTTAVIVVSAILIVFNAVVSIGGNVIIREEIVDNNNANIEITETFQLNVVAEQEIYERYESLAINNLGVDTFSLYEIEITTEETMIGVLQSYYLYNGQLYNIFQPQPTQICYGFDITSGLSECIIDWSTYEGGGVYLMTKPDRVFSVVTADITTTLQ